MPSGTVAPSLIANRANSDATPFLGRGIGAANPFCVSSSAFALSHQLNQPPSLPWPRPTLDVTGKEYEPEEL